MKSIPTKIAIAFCIVAAASVGVYLFVAKTAERTERNGTVNPAYEDRQLTTEPMPAFSERSLNLPPSNAVGTYTPETTDKSAASSDSKRQ